MGGNKGAGSAGKFRVYKAPYTPTYEETHSWWENNLPMILKTATHIAAAPLDLIAPGVGVATGAIAGEAVGLATRKAQGRTVGSEEFQQAGVGGATGVASGAAKWGTSEIGEALKVQRQAEALEKARGGYGSLDNAGKGFSAAGDQAGNYQNRFPVSGVNNQMLPPPSRFEFDEVFDSGLNSAPFRMG